MSNPITARDCCFSADVIIGSQANPDAKTAPLRMVVRSGQPIDHHAWGRVVHDMDGMEHKSRIPVDYQHDPKEIVGYANRFNVQPEGDLELRGAITPFKQEDRASEILFKASADRDEGGGVPYEGSIYFGREVEVERVTEDQHATVNGQRFRGPLTVIRKWVLRGAAVTPYGYDMNTVAEFALSNDPIEIREINQMSETQTAIEAEVEDKVDEAVDVADQNTAEDEAQAKSVDADAEGTDTKTETPEESSQLSESPAQTYMAEFGRVQGALYFADGVTLDEARKLECTRLTEENARLRARLDESEGLEEPLEFSQSKDGGVDSDVLTAIPADRVNM